MLLLNLNTVSSAKARVCPCTLYCPFYLNMGRRVYPAHAHISVWWAWLTIAAQIIEKKAERVCPYTLCCPFYLYMGRKKCSPTLCAA